MMRKCYTVFAVLFFLNIFNTCKGQSFSEIIDSLHSAYDNSDDQLQRIDLLNEIAYTYRRAIPDSIFAFANQAIALSKKYNYKQGLAYGYKNIGIGHFKKNSPADTIIYYYETAIEYAKAVDDYYTQAACYNNIGLIKSFGLSYNEAAGYFLEGLAIFDEHIEEESRLKALMLANTGTSYHRGGDNEKGIAYFEAALAMADRIGDLSIPSIFVDELARARMQEGDITGALRDITTLMPLHDEIEDFESKGETLLTLSEVKMEMQEYTEAIAHAEAALKLVKKHGFTHMQPAILIQLARGYSAEGELDTAIAKILPALAMEGAGLTLAIQADANKLLADLYARKGEYTSAYNYALKHSQLIIQDQDANKHRISTELEAKYQNEQQLLQIEILKEEQKDQTIKFYGSIAITLIFGGLSAFLVYTMRQKNQATSALKEKHEDLKKAEQKLNEKNKELKQYIESNMQLENFAHLASHDLREPMRNIVSFSQLLARSSKNKLNDRELEYLDFIRRGTRRIEGLVKDLLDYSIVTHSPLSWSEFPLQELIDEVETDIQQALGEEDGTLVIKRIPKSIQADRRRIYQVFQNLFTNALRYRREDVEPVITVEGKEDALNYNFSVSDNGIGIDARFYDQIFILFKTLENKSVINRSGIGLATCKKVVEDHQGKIWVESVIGQGSTFHFTIAKHLS